MTVKTGTIATISCFVSDVYGADGQPEIYWHLSADIYSVDLATKSGYTVNKGTWKERLDEDGKGDMVTTLAVWGVSNKADTVYACTVVPRIDNQQTDYKTIITLKTFGN